MNKSILLILITRSAGTTISGLFATVICCCGWWRRKTDFRLSV